MQIAEATKLANDLKVIEANPVLFAQLSAYPNPAKIPPKLVAKAVAAAGGGATGAAVLASIAANKAGIQDVIAHAADLLQIQTYAGPLKALAAVPPSVFAYLKLHGGPVQKAASQTVGQWKTWYWICFGGIIFFLLSIPLLRGRWKPSDARRDEAEHEAMVARELAAMQA